MNQPSDDTIERTEALFVEPILVDDTEPEDDVYDDEEARAEDSDDVEGDGSSRPSTGRSGASGGGADDEFEGEDDVAAEAPTLESSAVREVVRGALARSAAQAALDAEFAELEAQADEARANEAGDGLDDAADDDGLAELDASDAADDVEVAKGGPATGDSAHAAGIRAEDDADDTIEIMRARGTRDLALGAATAEGLATMTPVTRVTEAPHRELGDAVLTLSDLTKRFGDVTAVDGISFTVRQGSFTGIVGPNGAGKTTTLSMATGLLKPSSGTVDVAGVDVWANPREAHRHIGVLPDRLRLFDQLTGAQLLYYTGMLRGLSSTEARERTQSLLEAFELDAASNRLVVDYSAGMAKKIALASALIHSPRLLVLDEPFDTIDPVSAGQLSDILLDYVDRGGTVLLSSHSMDLVQRVCDHVAVIVRGEILAEGTVAEVRGDITLEERFRTLVHGTPKTEGLDWLDLSFN